MPRHRPPGAAEGSPASHPETASTIAGPGPSLITPERVITNVNTASTPVYDSVRAAAVEDIPSSVGRPPHHHDIYGQLCREFGNDPRSSDFGSLPPHHRANASSTRPRRSSRPIEPAPTTVEGRRRAGAHALPWWHGAPHPA